MSLEVPSLQHESLYRGIATQLKLLHDRQTKPLQRLITEYSTASSVNREQQVRLHQLEKEVLLLREENAHANVTLSKYGGLDTFEELSKLRIEIGFLYKEKSRLLEDLMGARSEGAAEKSRADCLSEELDDAKAELAGLRAQIQQEIEARIAAASEVEGAIADKERAVVEAEQYESENKILMKKLVRLKEEEAERITKISLLHEEAMHEATRMKREAASDREAAELIRSKMKKDLSEYQDNFEAVSLKNVMGLGEGGHSSYERVLPSTPCRSTLSHKGGACGLAAASGNMFASCGQNQQVCVWDVGSYRDALGAIKGAQATPFLLLQGHGSFNDVTFTSDGGHILAAASDRSMMLWDVSSGGLRHTLTGHSGGVTGLSSSSSDSRCAISIGEDRVLKVWDLSRGFCVRSCPCAKMPLVVAMGHDGSTAATGHSDGSILLWDARSRDSHISPNETKNHSMAICSLSRGAGDSLICASRDNTVSIIDLRGGGLRVSQTLRCPLGFGLVGGIGRQRCKVDISNDGRFIAAGGMDGSVVVWTMNQPSSPSILKHHKEPVIATVWNPDASFLATADKGGVVNFWNCLPESSDRQ